MRVPVAIGDYLILDAVRESGGTAITVSEEEIREAQIALGRLAGVYAAPEGGATYAALEQADRARRGWRRRPGGAVPDRHGHQVRSADL